MKFKKEKPKVKKEKPVLKPRKSKPSEVKSGPKPMGGEQLAAVSSLIEKVSKKYKDDGLLHRMGDVAVSKVGFVPSGAIGLDYALGIGGYPRGRIIEIYGPEASGKTTLTLHAIAECQKAGGVAAFIDAEHALDMDYAGKLGIDVDKITNQQILRSTINKLVLDQTAKLKGALSNKELAFSGQATA